MKNIAILHAHTTCSDGTLSPIQLVKDVSSKGVKFLAITDHDTMSGVNVAKDAGKKYGVEIIAGEEIQTSLPRGLHIVGLFLKKAIPHSKSIIWTVDQIHQQRGLAILAHPMVRILGVIPAPTGAVQIGDIKKLIIEMKFDGIELIHPNLNSVDRKSLKSFYNSHQDSLGAALGTSDSHFGNKDVMTVFTTFSGKKINDLYLAIRNKQTLAVMGESASVTMVERIVQFEKAFIEMGLQRYRKMLKRWISLDFGGVSEQL